MKRVLLLLLLAGCRGQTSSQPPFHLIGDMDRQPKYRPEAASTFFADGRAMRPPVEGTVAVGALDEDPPLTATAAVAARGRERFDIYCAPCHDRSAGGHGLVVQRGFPPPTDLASDRVRAFTDAEIFQIISNGVRNMPSYRAQVPPRDRQAIVLWLRVLQRSQHATVADVPPELRSQIEPEGSP